MTYLDDGDVQLYHGDALGIMKQLPERSVQTVVTSPPYWQLRNYGFAGQLGLEDDPYEYVDAIYAVFAEVWRVLRDDGTLWLNLGSSYFSDPAKGGSGTPNGRNGRGESYGRAALRDARPSDSPCTAPQDSTDPDSACPDLCDGCAAATSTRIADNDRLEREEPRRASLTGHDTWPSDYAVEPPAAFPLAAPASTIPRSSPLHPGECSHCSNCGACLSVLRSSSRDARLCARMGSSTGGTSLRESDGRNRGTDAGGMAWVNYTRRLKPKDMVPIPWMVAMALQADGWYLRSDIVWSKPNPMPESVTDRPTKAHEYVFLLSKQARYFYDADAIREPATTSEIFHGGYDKPGITRPTAVRNGRKGDYSPFVNRPDGVRNARSVWEIATQPFPEAHFATYPEELVRRCILAGSRPGDTVLDPFVGSGTTALVARKHERRCIGIDLSADYLAIAARRLSQLSLLALVSGGDSDE